MVKALRFSRFGPPHEVVELVDLPEPEPLRAGEVLLDVEAASINPADLLQMQGRYGAQPLPLPAFVGGEAVGIVREFAADVTHLRVGDRVLLLLAARGNWRTRLKADAQRLFALPQADPLQLAMLSVNPATASLLLSSFENLACGDWVIQNAANSGVGYAVLALAKAAGVRTINVVRRLDVAAALSALGADAVLVDGPRLACEVAELTGDAHRPRLALDAIGGDATRRLAQALAEGGSVVNYGMLSGEPCMLDPGDVVFRDVRLRGFWLARWFRTATPEALKALYLPLVQSAASGALHVPVEASYGLEEAPAALAHAARAARGGKILFTPSN